MDRRDNRTAYNQDDDAQDCRAMERRVSEQLTFNHYLARLWGEEGALEEDQTLGHQEEAKRALTLPQKIGLLLAPLIPLYILVFRPPLGADSYYFMMINHLPLWFGQYFPVLWSVVISASLVWLAKQFDVDDAWYVPILSFLAIAWPYRLSVFEDDLFGLPLAILGLGFAVRWVKNKNNLDLGFYFITFLLGLALWRGVAIFFLWTVPFFFKGRLQWLASISVAFVPYVFLHNVSWIGEQNSGIFSLYLLALLSASYYYAYSEPDFVLQNLVFSTLPYVLAMTKFAVYAVPLLAVEFAKTNWRKHSAYVFMMFAFAPVYLFFATPTIQEIHEVQTITAMLADSEYANDWSLGHWMNYFGGHAELDNLYPKQIKPEQLGTKYIVVFRRSCPEGYEHIYGSRIQLCGLSNFS